MTDRFRIVHLVVLMAFLLGWMIASVAVQAQRSKEDEAVSPATQLMIVQASSANTAAIATISAELGLVRQMSNDARDEVREMRHAVWGMAGTILLSLLMQVAQIRKGKATA